MPLPASAALPAAADTRSRRPGPDAPTWPGPSPAGGGRRPCGPGGGERVGGDGGVGVGWDEGRPSGASLPGPSSLSIFPSGLGCLARRGGRGAVQSQGSSSRARSRRGGRGEGLVVGYPEGPGTPRVGALRSPPARGLGERPPSRCPAAVVKGWGRAPAGEGGLPATPHASGDSWGPEKG